MIGIRKVGIDLDGVLADFTSRMRDLLNSLFNLNLPDDYVPQDWHWADANLKPGMMAEAWKVIGNTPDFWESASPYVHNMVEMVSWFHDHADRDHEVYFITARNETAGRTARDQSARWLREYIGSTAPDINVFVTSKGTDKKYVLEALGVHYFIDDHHETINHTRAVKSCKSYLLDQPWNRKDRNKDIEVVYSLAEFFEKTE